MIKIFAKQLIKKGKEEEFLKICAELVEKSRAEEGNVFYSINRSKENDRLFAFIECWKDQAAIEIHNATPHFTTLVPQIGPLCEEKYPAEFYEEV
jgi:quinol monooxygenase YgiN